MKSLYKRYLIIASGWIITVLGIAGLFLPGLQGILFLLIGLGLLAEEYHWAKKLLETAKQRFPGVDRKLQQAKAKRKELMGKLFRREEPPS